jgi:hypothetical protein
MLVRVSPHRDRVVVRSEEAVRALAVATGDLATEPRPELLNRVLDGLRGLPPRPGDGVESAWRTGDVTPRAVPLPRRR